MENTNVKANTTEQEVKQELKIRLAKPLNFNPVGEISISTTRELSKVINDIFVQVFADYFGCNLRVQFQPERQSYIIIPRLFFRVQKNYDDNKTYAFRTLNGRKSSDDVIGRVQRMSQSATSGCRALITDEGKSVLENFMITPIVKASNFDWAGAYSTVATNEDTFIQVFKLDILKFISTLYGEVDATGSKQYYQITPTGVVKTNQYKAADDWSVQILRLNHANEANAAELLGFNIPSQSSMPNVVTETTSK